MFGQHQGGADGEESKGLASLASLSLVDQQQQLPGSERSGLGVLGGPCSGGLDAAMGGAMAAMVGAGALGGEWGPRGGVLGGGMGGSAMVGGAGGGTNGGGCGGGVGGTQDGRTYGGACGTQDGHRYGRENSGPKGEHASAHGNMGGWQHGGFGYGDEELHEMGGIGPPQNQV